MKPYFVAFLVVGVALGLVVAYYYLPRHIEVSDAYDPMVH